MSDAGAASTASLPRRRNSVRPPFPSTTANHSADPCRWLCSVLSGYPPFSASGGRPSAPRLVRPSPQVAAQPSSRRAARPLSQGRPGDASRSTPVSAGYRLPNVMPPGLGAVQSRRQEQASCLQKQRPVVAHARTPAGPRLSWNSQRRRRLAGPRQQQHRSRSHLWAIGSSK